MRKMRRIPPAVADGTDEVLCVIRETIRNAEKG